MIEKQQVRSGDVARMESSGQLLLARKVSIPFTTTGGNLHATSRPTAYLRLLSIEINGAHMGKDSSK